MPLVHDVVDVLVVTFESPERARRCLDAATQASERVRLWLWHNGTHAETLEVTQSFADHPRVHRFHHSVENVRLRPALNWIFGEGEAALVSKLDDDAVVPPGWPGPLIDAHLAEPRFGVLGSWRFMPEDFDPDNAARKTQTFAGGHQVMRNLWVDGSSFVMKRRCIEQVGQIRDDQSFTTYCIELAKRGWINGYYVPFVRYGNLDDPRYPDTLLRTDEDLVQRLPLSAQVNGVTTLEAWTAQIRRSAHIVQTEPFEAKHYSGWRYQLRRARRLARRVLGRPAW